MHMLHQYIVQSLIFFSYTESGSLMNGCFIQNINLVLGEPRWTNLDGLIRSKNL